MPDGAREMPMPITRVHVSPEEAADHAFRYQFWADPPVRLSRMLWSNGATNASYTGIVWDGDHKAHIGFHHNARDRFETAIVHTYQAFVNFREAGVKMGPQQPFATAETEFRSCIFADSEAGLSVIDFNYYNLVVDGCLFQRNGYGIYADRYGQVYVRNSRFEHSRRRDLRLGSSHKHAVRRCESVGSNAFVEGSHVTLQDCRVSSWTNPDGAIILTSSAAPVMVFDCVFDNPPSPQPPIRVTDAALRMIVSSNRAQGVERLLTGADRVVEMPPGTLDAAVAADGLDLFFEAPEPFAKRFDAVRDFGAGEGGDQTAAVQATIDAAREYGQGAVAYFPPRRYRISRTIEITGEHYTIAGTGYHTEFQWTGEEGGVVFSIVDPQNITLSNLHILGHSVPRNMLGIRQTSTGRPSFITYDRVRAVSHGAGYRADGAHEVRGIEFRDLGEHCRVHVKRMFASGAFINSTAADILLRFWDGGPIVVANPGDAPRTGFLGGLNANHGGEIVVKDSLDVVFTEYYNEQGEHGLIQLSGKPADAPGRFTIGAARLHLWERAPFFAEIGGYRGQFTYAHAHVTFDHSPAAYTVRQTSASPFTLAMLAHTGFGFDIQLDPSGQLVRAANHGVDDAIPAGGLDAIGAALDHWRLLGRKDVEFRRRAAEKADVERDNL